MKILPVNQNYNQKRQDRNTNFSAVLVKSHFELFGGRKSLSELLTNQSGSYMNKITRLINRIRGVDETHDLKAELIHKQFPCRSQDIYLSDKESDEVISAIQAVEDTWLASCENKEWGDNHDYDKVINKLWEEPTGPVRALRNLAEKLLAEGEKNPIEHVVTACATRLKKANEKVRDDQYAIGEDLYAALNGRRFPEQLEFPFAKPKLRKRIKTWYGQPIGFEDVAE